MITIIEFGVFTFMKKILLIISVFFAQSLNANAEQKGISISDEWARPIIIAGRPGGAYFTIKNNNQKTDRLISVTSSISKRVEIHEHIMDNGIMKMSQVPSIAIPPRGTVKLKPGGYHIMIFQSDRKYTLGESIDLTLEFESGIIIKKTLEVYARQP